MSGETNENDSTISSTFWSQKTAEEKLDVLAMRISAMDHVYEQRMQELTDATHANTQTLRTVMVGWNAFLKSAEAQLKVLFKGTIPAPLLRKLVQTAFKGLEDMERKGK